jgi:predicted metal-dependent phosphoesterase TrpH
MDMTRGSVWRKWDLHIHSPISYLNNQYPKIADGTPDWEQYLEVLENSGDIGVIGVTDYFSVTGYKALREFKEA